MDPKEEMRQIAKSNPERLTIGLLGPFTCPLCERLRSRDDTYGAFRYGGDLVFLCKECDTHESS